MDHEKGGIYLFEGMFVLLSKGYSVIRVMMFISITHSDGHVLVDRPMNGALITLD